MGPYPNGLRSVSCDQAIRYSGLGVRSVGPGMMSQVRFHLFMTSHLYIHLNMFFSASLSSFRKKKQLSSSHVLEHTSHILYPSI